MYEAGGLRLGMSWWGWAGGTLSVVQLVPQIWLLHRTRSGTQISRLALSIRVTAYAMYLVHASNIQDPPLFFMTLAGLILLSIIIVQIGYFDVCLARRADVTAPQLCQDPSQDPKDPQ